MSAFAKEVREYATTYGLSRTAAVGMGLHWPLFRLRYLEGFGPRRKALIARRLLRLIDWYRFPHRIRRRYGGYLTVSLPAARDEFASFREVMIKRAYASPWPLHDVASVLDLGANTGTALWYFAHATPATRMIAVEPNPVLIPRLRRNASAVPVPVDVRHLAVAATDRTSIGFIVDPNHRHGRIGDDDVSVQVPCTSLRRLLDSLGPPPPDLLKLDIEGAEHALMAAEPESFTSFRYVFGEVHGPPSARARFSAALEELGFGVSRDAGDEVDQIRARRRPSASM